MIHRLGVFGGTFDPIHLGHLIIATEALYSLDLDFVLFLPAGRPPHKPNRDLSPNEDRWAMLEVAIEDRPGFIPDPLDLAGTGPSYTVDLLRRLSARNPGAELIFIIGADSLRDFHTWHEPSGIVAQARVAVAARPGIELDLSQAIRRTPSLSERVIVLETPLIGISSTEIRERVRKRRPIWYRVPRAVEEYIEVRGLYLDEQQRHAE
jgi:nicotinate-nucleotide adenylyltransferase